MKLYLDNIVFALQPAGGISTVWYELEQRAMADKRLDLTIMDYPCNNIQRKRMNVADSIRMDCPLRKLERYREPLFEVNEPIVFHSSYFRVMQNPKVANVTTIHDLTYHICRHGLPKAVHLHQEEHALRHSRAVVCISQSTKRDLLRLYPSVREENVRVIYNGVSPLFHVSDEKNITDFESGGYLLFVGAREAEYKNFVMAVEIARRMKMPLVMVGAPLKKEEHEILQDELGENHYQIFSHISSEQLNVLYNHAFALLYPSAYEGFGLPILEAQKADCVAVVQGVSSLPEVAGDGAIVVPPSNSLRLADEITDALLQLKNGTIDATALRRAGQENAKHFTWDAMYNQLYQLYNEISR